MYIKDYVYKVVQVQPLSWKHAFVEIVNSM